LPLSQTQFVRFNSVSKGVISEIFTTQVVCHFTNQDFVGEVEKSLIDAAKVGIAKTVEMVSQRNG
jgi:hypothetical protein